MLIEMKNNFNVFFLLLKDMNAYKKTKIEPHSEYYDEDDEEDDDDE